MKVQLAEMTPQLVAGAMMAVAHFLGVRQRKTRLGEMLRKLEGRIEELRDRLTDLGEELRVSSMRLQYRLDAIEEDLSKRAEEGTGPKRLPKAVGGKA